MKVKKKQMYDKKIIFEIVFLIYQVKNNQKDLDLKKSHFF